MNTPQQREQGRRRVAKYRQTHLAEITQARSRAADHRDQGARGRRPCYRIIELTWPPPCVWAGRSMAVVIARAGESLDAVAARGGALGGWLTVLRGEGLEPVEDNRWVPRLVTNLRTARGVRDLRIATIVAWNGGVSPVWLL